MARKGESYHACPHCEASFPLVGTDIIPPHNVRILDAYPAVTFTVAPCPGSGQKGER